MSSDREWDVYKYFNPYEPPEQWELRKKFLEANKDKYPEQKLISLAAAFIDIEVLGCSYNPELTQIVGELSKGVAEEYRERRKMKLHSVYVSASDAAASRVRGQTTATTTSEPNVVGAPISSAIPLIDITDEEPATDPGYVDDVDVIELSGDSPESEEEFHTEQGSNTLKRKIYQKGKKGKKVKGQIYVSRDLRSKEIPRECWTSYGHLVLIEDADTHVAPQQIIERSASLCRAKLIVQEKHHTIVECQQVIDITLLKVYIREKDVAVAADASKKKAREMVFQKALQKLQEQCFTIKIKRRRYDQIVGRNFGEPEVAEAEDPQIRGPVVPAVGGVALRMMANMGWTGGGLGKAQQGIVEPISLTAKMNRSGFGSKFKEGKKEIAEKPGTSFENKALLFLESYARSNSEQDLVFATEFTSDERNILHNLAAKFDLKSKSYGKQKQRHLVISRKVEPFRIMRDLLKPGYISEKYELVRPKGPQPEINENLNN